MSITASRIVGVVVLVLSAASAVVGGLYFAAARVKHGLLFAAIFVVLLLFGLILVRAKKSTEGQSK